MIFLTIPIIPRGCRAPARNRLQHSTCSWAAKETPLLRMSKMFELRYPLVMTNIAIENDHL